MKKLLLLIFIALASISLFANQTISFKQIAKSEISSISDSGFNANFAFEAINTVEVNTERGMFTNLQIDNYTHTAKLGAPKLPVLRKIISVPFGAKVRAEMVDFDIIEAQLDLPVIPAQPSISKNENAEIPAFEYNQAAYNKRGYDSKPNVRVEELGIMRGMRLFALVFEPVKYDPSTNSIKVYNNVNISVKFDNADLNLTAEKRAKTFSPYFEYVYSRSIFNYTKNRDELTNYPISYIIISDPMFEDQLAPFIQWKTEMGFNIITGYTNDIGTTKPEIKSFIQEQYDNATAENPAPSFVLFVGDVAQIPAYNGTTGSHITDLDYVKLDGTDFLPEMYYGRFSANNTSELQPQIDKTLEYEKYEMPDPSYLGEVVMIAGVDSGNAPTYGNGAINYGTQQYFNMNHNIESHTYLYPASGSSASQIIANVANGIGYINYTAHGSPTTWHDPSFTISDINSLGNIHEYPLAVGNCCLTNKFETQTCFGEAWLRAENQGAIGYIGGTNSTYWDEDYWWAVGAGPIVGSGATYEQTGRGVYDGLFHDQENEATFENWFTSTGSMLVNGNLAVMEGNSTRPNYYWEIYSLMGDPSLTAYLGVPTTNEVSYPSTILIGMENMTITAAPYSYASLTYDGEIYGTALIGENGSATMNFTPFTVPGNAKLVITAQNKEPIIEIIEIIPNEGPYTIVESYNINGSPAFGQTISFDIDFRNVGSEPATGITATLSTEDAYLTVTNSSLTVGDISAETTSSFTEAFGVEIADNAPDGYSTELTVTMVGNEATWTANIYVTLQAPVFEIGNMTIDDSGNNGLLDAGETATITIPVTNSGSVTSPDLIANLVTSTPNIITIDSAEFELAGLESNETGNITFEITVADDAEEGSTAILAMAINAGAYTANKTFYPSVGLVFENFETGDFSSFDWEQGALGWQISDTAQEGSYSMQNSDINDNQTASISLTMDVAADGEISFWKKVSSESSYDYLRFYINGQSQAEWSGTEDWTEETFDVSAGEVTFEWKYEKDGSVSSNSDCGWIDMITFPGGGSITEAPIFNLNITEINFGDVVPNETVTETFMISNLGNAELNGTIDVTEDFEISASEYSLAIGENIEVTVSFTPETAGEYTGSVAITSNDTNNPEATIALSGTGNGTNSDDLIPLVTELQGNYPNPFNPTTTIKYALNADTKVELEIYNIKGQAVKTLVNENQAAGYHSIVWNGKDNSNRQTASGIYFYKFKAGNIVSMKKMILMK